MQATANEGVFTTVKVVEARPEHLGRHLARLAQSARIAGLDTPDSSAVRREVDAALQAAPLPLGRMRIDRDGAAPRVSTEPLVAHPRATTVVRAQELRDPHSPLAGAKSVALGRQGRALVSWAQEHGAGDTVVATIDGLLAEGATSNVFYVVDGELRTPTTATGLLNGIVRQLLLETLEVREVDAPYEVLHTADEVFLTSSLRGVQAVTAVDGHQMGGPGPVTQRVARALAALPTDD
jgi:branched-chain amino acid aminotransferase